ncbi:MAG: methyl-accepting chemotaxis protein [bacterium]
MNNISLHNRRRILINRRFQLKYAMILVMVVLFFLTFFAYDMFHSLKFYVPYFELTSGIKEKLFHDLTFFWIKILSFIFVVILLSIYFTHRIAGPMYRLSKDIITMANESDLTKIFALRENDEFKELSWALNEFVNSLKTRLISDDNFREKVQFTIKNTLLELDKKPFSEESRDNIVNLLNRLYKESYTSPVQFKL